jgi:phosphoserine phosphatase RsbU/P
VVSVTNDRARLALAAVLLVAVAGVAAVVYATGPGLVPVAWLAVGPLLACLVLSPRVTAVVAGWALALGFGLVIRQSDRPAVLVSHLSVLALLAVLAVANSALRTIAQRRLRQVRAVARAAQSAIVHEVPPTITAGRLASRYISSAPESRVGGDLLEVFPDPDRPRWVVGDTRGKGLDAVRLASVAMTSFREACAQPGLSLPEVARVVDRSVTEAGGDEDFVTAVFAELDPRGWLQLVICGHPPPLRLTAEGDLQVLSPDAYATPLGLHPDIRTSTFTVSLGDRLIFYTDGVLEARDQAGQYFRLQDFTGILRGPDLQAAADGLVERLLAHSGGRLDDDAALLLLEATSGRLAPERELELTLAPRALTAAA